MGKRDRGRHSLRGIEECTTKERFEAVTVY